MNKKERILVVEESELAMELIYKILGPYFEIDTAVDGIEALEKLDSGKQYDLIITNHIMPRIDGKEFIKKVRERLPSIPIAAFTYDGWGGGLIRAGADLLISKPFRVLPFLRSIRRLLGYNDSEEQLIDMLRGSDDR